MTVDRLFRKPLSPEETRPDSIWLQESTEAVSEILRHTGEVFTVVNNTPFHRMAAI